MNIIKPLLFTSSSLLITTLLITSSFATESKYEAGEKLFNSACAACHGITGGMDMNKRIAPPIAGVRKHYLDIYPDEASFVKAISSWVEKQDESKSLMRGAIRKFKIMPPIVIPKEDVEKIAAYIYSGNIQKPEGLDQHMNEMHGKTKPKDQPKMGQAQGNHKGMQRNQMMNMMKKSMQNRRNMNKNMMMQLDLSPQQKQKMQKLIQQKKATIQPLKKQLQYINQTINQLDTSNKNYKQQIFSYADKKAKLIYRIVIEKGESRMNIESILTPQQRAKFTQMRQNHFNNQHN